MTDKFKNKYRIPSARASWWNYASNAAYFITICTKHRAHYFGEIVQTPCMASVRATEIGQIAESEWLKTPSIRPDMNLELDEFVVMPNHIHGIISIAKSNAKDNLSDLDIWGKTSSAKGDSSQSVEIRHCLVSLHTPQNLHIDSPASSETRQCLVSTEVQRPTDTKESILAYPLKCVSNKLSPGQKRFRNQGKGTVSSILGSYKSIVSINAHRLNSDFGCQARFYDNIVRSAVEYNTISNYIKTNPKRLNEDKFFK